MNSKSLISNQNVTMSSLEIAQLTGKRHDHILRDIRVMFLELEGDLPKFGEIESGDLLRFEEIEKTYLDARGREQVYYQLDEELTLTLLTGYSTKLRHAVVKRWKELERRLAEPIYFAHVIASRY